jgi:hypothetical protein
LRLGYARFDANLRARALVLPPDPGGKVKALALEASGGAADDAEKARRIERFLKSRYSYSTFADSRGRSLDNFLFGSKKGNCEYFASAGVVLLRELGVPARLVTGFVAEDWNEYGGYWDIRQRNAHAWVEAYLPGQGWTSFDPTPAQSAFSFSADALTRRMERLVDAIQSEWYRSVIGYDVGSQSNTFKKIGVAFSFSALFDWLRRLSFLGAGLWIGFGLWTEAVKARRRWETARRLGVYGRAEALLARKGLARPADLTPREFASSVASKRPELSALKNLAELHYRERYAGAALTDEQARHAERLLAELGAKL